MAKKQTSTELTDRISNLESKLAEKDLEIKIKDFISNTFLPHPDETVYADALAFILKTFSSEFGTFGYFAPDGSYVSPAMSRAIYWEMCNVPDKEIIFKKGTFGGVFGRAITEEKTIVDNKGPFNTPKGHIRINNTIVTPVFFNNKVISAIHLANKPDGYSEKDIKLLEFFAKTLAPVLYTRLQRDQTEALLAESEERYRGIVEDTPVMLCRFLPDGEITYVNEAYCTFCSKTSEELVGHSFLDLIPKSDHELVMTNISSLTVDTPTQSHELKVITSNGNINWHRWTNRALFDEDGQVTAYQAIGEDITDRKQAHEALKNSETHLRTLIETIPDLVWLKNSKGVYLGCNPKFERFFGAKQADIVGKTDYDFVDRELADFFREKDKLAMDAGKPSLNEEEIIYADGGHKEILETIKTPMFDQTGNLIGVLGVARDITARKKMEEELQQSEKSFRTVLENSIDTIYYLNLVTGTYDYLSPSCEEVYGYTQEEFIERGLKGTVSALHPEDLEKLEDHINKLFSKTVEDEISPTITYRFKHKKLGYRWISDTRKVLFDDYGSPISIIGASRDITDHKNAAEERKRMEEQLHQAQKMEAIGTLAGGIAHDFNNILGVILGYADMAKEDAPKGSKYTADLDKVLTAGNRAKDLVKQILAFSRQAEVERIPVKLQSLIKEAVKMLRASIPATVEIQVEIDSKCNAVLADPTQIHQILMNLCTNANHAMEHAGGILKLELKRTEIINDYELGIKPGQYVELVVADTGSGIGPDVINKIFEPYFTTKEAGKGTGMGLSIVHGIIADYGGTITVESKLNKGTTFHVYFPVIGKVGTEIEEIKEQIPKGEGRILFIDDEELLTEMGQDMLERLGYTVTVRQNSLDALTTFQNNPSEFDAVITDQTMPGMTGADLARRMLQIRPGIPIILCTGYSNLIDEGTAKSFGIKEFALKPLTKGAIANLLKKVLDIDNSLYANV